MVENGAIVYVIALFIIVLVFSVYKLVSKIQATNIKKAKLMAMNKIILKDMLIKIEQGERVKRMKHNLSSSKLTNYARMYGYQREPIEWAMESHNNQHQLPNGLRGIAIDDDRRLTYYFERFNGCSPRRGDLFKNHNYITYVYTADAGRYTWMPISKADIQLRLDDAKKEDSSQTPLECKSIW